MYVEEDIEIREDGKRRNKGCLLYGDAGCRKQEERDYEMDEGFRHGIKVLKKHHDTKP